MDEVINLNNIDSNKNTKLNNYLTPYKALCTEYYDLDKPEPTKEALSFYIKYAENANGKILEPMCGSGRFIIPILQKGYDIYGFDNSSQMIEACKKKCINQGLPTNFSEVSFQNFSPKHLYKLVIIPSGSFCLLLNEDEINNALNTIYNSLELNGKFVFEIDTLSIIDDNPGIWNGSWINKPNGSKIVHNSISKFNSKTNIQTSLNKYELWENGIITKTELDEFKIKLYSMHEIETLLEKHDFNIVGKWTPYTKYRPNVGSESVVYECEKI